MNMEKVNKQLLAPVLAGFFIMGFCDIVAPISVRIAAEYTPDLQHTISYLPTMVFLWFLLLSTPVAALMNRIGRKRTALVGYGCTFLGLMTPWLAGTGCPLAWYFVGFGMLGIGNTVVQVAINPLLATIVPSRQMTSYLTVGQIFRNLSLLLLAPLVMVLVAWFGDWRLLMPLYAALTLAGSLWLQFTDVAEPESEGHPVSPAECFKLLNRSRVLIATIGVAAFIAADVAIGFLSVRLIDNPSSMFTTTGFYACRIVGTLVGAVVLLRISDVRYLSWNMAVALLATLFLVLTRNHTLIYAAVGVLGFVLACVFATFYAVATKDAADHANEVSGLMIMAISAGAVSAPLCSRIISLTGDPHWALLFAALCIAYMLWASLKLGKNKN